jgi:hypothetical protein
VVVPVQRIRTDNVRSHRRHVRLIVHAVRAMLAFVDGACRRRHGQRRSVHRFALQWRLDGSLTA